MASLSTCHLGLWFGWQILLNLVTFLQNCPLTLWILAPHEDLIDVCLRSLIHNMGPFNEVKNLQQQPGPIAKVLDELQSDSCSTVDAYE